MGLEMEGDIYHAIAEPNRRQLLDLLSDREQSVQNLMPFFTISIGAVSQHLKVLLDCGLVQRRKQGRYRLYRASPEALREVHDWTAQFSEFWTTRLDKLGDYLDEAQ